MENLPRMLVHPKGAYARSEAHGRRGKTALRVESGGHVIEPGRRFVLELER